MKNVLIVDVLTGPVFGTDLFLKYNDLVTSCRMKAQDKFFSGIGIKVGPARSYSRGLLFIAAVLEKLGAKVFYINSDFTADYRKTCQEIIDEKKIDLLLVSAKTNTYPLVLDLLKQCKLQKPSLTTILGGPHATALFQECFQDRYVDIIVLGEGEETVRDLYLTLKSKRSPWNVAGIVYKDARGQVVQTKSRPRIDNLDDLPIPAYHLLPGGLNQYYVYIDTSRGCCYNCAFCSGPNYWHRMVKTRSAKNFLAELGYLEQRISDYNLLHISDPALGLTVEQKKVLASLKNRKNKFYFSCDIKANYVSPDLIKEMLMANINIFSIGIETVNNKSLSLINKQSTAQQEIKACEIIKSAKDAFVKSYWITGLPGETSASLFKQSKLIFSLLDKGIVDQICNHILVPYPGTALFQNPEKFGMQIIHRNWIHYEGRSYPVTYRLITLDESEIYNYFLQSLIYELKYYQNKSKGLKVAVSETIKFKKSKPSIKLSFQETKGRLL